MTGEMPASAAEEEEREKEEEEEDDDIEKELFGLTAGALADVQEEEDVKGQRAEACRTLERLLAEGAEVNTIYNG